MSPADAPVAVTPPAVWAWRARLNVLRDEAVRDLAFLLAAPPAWLASANLLPEALLGEHGWQQLAELDATPQPLHDWLAAHPSYRLGRYAEALFGYWCAHAPHLRLVAHNLALRDGKHTLGEFDFVIELDGVRLHVELASKFYLQFGDGPAGLIGASLRDGWLLKAAKLEQQLALRSHPTAASVWPEGIAPQASVARACGWLFARPEQALPSGITSDAPRGWWAGLSEAWPQQQAASRWALLPRARWLAPARLVWTDAVSAADLRAQLVAIERPQLVVELAAAEEGMAEEVARGFVLPAGWPDMWCLQQLKQRLSTKLC